MDGGRERDSGAGGGSPRWDKALGRWRWGGILAQVVGLALDRGEEHPFHETGRAVNVQSL